MSHQKRHLAKDAAHGEPSGRGLIMHVKILRRRGFSLIELAVVMGIGGLVVVGAFIPLIVSSQDLARRLQCAAHLRQFGQAASAHVEALQVFPTGGVHPWARIENYVRPRTVSSPARPFDTKRQGIGWVYQLLPFLPEHSIEQPVTEREKDRIGLSILFCPARRARSYSPVFGDLLRRYDGLPQSRSNWRLLRHSHQQ